MLRMAARKYLDGVLVLRIPSRRPSSQRRTECSARRAILPRLPVRLIQPIRPRLQWIPLPVLSVLSIIQRENEFPLLILLPPAIDLDAGTLVIRTRPPRFRPPSSPPPFLIPPPPPDLDWSAFD